MGTTCTYKRNGVARTGAWRLTICSDTLYDGIRMFKFLSRFRRFDALQRPEANDCVYIRYKQSSSKLRVAERASWCREFSKTESEQIVEILTGKGVSGRKASTSYPPVISVEIGIIQGYGEVEARHHRGQVRKCSSYHLSVLQSRRPLWQSSP